MSEGAELTCLCCTRSCCRSLTQILCLGVPHKGLHRRQEAQQLLRSHSVRAYPGASPSSLSSRYPLLSAASSLTLLCASYLKP